MFKPCLLPFFFTNGYVARRESVECSSVPLVCETPIFEERMGIRQLLWLL